MKILFVYQTLATFVEKDLRILQQAHEVRALQWRGTRDLWELYKGIRETDAVFCWFGKLHAYWAVRFARMLGKKSIVVAGGDDVACVPEIGYGMYSYWWKRWCPKYVFANADLTLCVSEYNREETLRNTSASTHKVRMIYHGFDHHYWRVAQHVKKEDIALTVGRVTTETWEKKGIVIFAEAARHAPEIPFYVVGPVAPRAIEERINQLPDNLTFSGGLYGDALIEMYSRAKVYIQASIHESFGCSVAEAMLCECIPVASKRGALPEVVGNTGSCIEELTAERLASQVRIAMQSDKGPEARERIRRHFPIEKRREELLEAVREVAGD